MSHLGSPGSDGPPLADCRPDGPLPPGRSVVDAVECGSARFLTLTHATGGVTPTYLVLTADDDDESATPLSSTDVLSMPEIQNAIAYFGSGVESVRVQTQSARRVALREHVDALGGEDSAFAFAGRTFHLDVVLG
ncbi:hypothetical protein [Halobacterium zhouii]|uniref:hypothetical protein n=1 Tax=Halobacterium zhouii TaxID=2902624 RepID=UPI001E54B182|nr:hypothetical protein [Halobacterium zhouii]